MILTPAITHPSSYPYTILSTDLYIIVDSSFATTVFLPSNPQEGFLFVIKDGKGLAGSNPIIVDGNSNTIDSMSMYFIQNNYGFIGVLFDGTEWKVVNR